MTDTVSDEIFAIARKALLSGDSGEDTDSMLRSALEAVAPLLRAQGMRKAAGIAENWDSFISEKILARANELEKNSRQAI